MTTTTQGSGVAKNSPSNDEQEVIHLVMDQLGRPKNLFRTVAKKVWGNQYRVNVYCTDESAQSLKTVTITDSFFVTLSGNEIVSTPTIARKYQ